MSDRSPGWFSVGWPAAVLYVIIARSIGMDLSAALRDAVLAARRRPADLLPFYVLAAAIPVIARTVSFVGFAAIYAYLSFTGRTERVRSALADRDLSAMPDPETEPEAFGRWASEVGVVLEPLFDPVVAVLLAVTLALALAVTVLLHAGVAAGQYAVCIARLRDERATLAGIGGVRSHWLSILVLSLLEFAVWIAVTLVAGLAIAVAAVVHPILAVLVGLVAFLVWTVLLLATRAVLAFAPVSVVVDDVGPLDGVAGAMAFIRANPAEALGYYALAVASLFLLASAAGVASFVGAPSVVGLASLLVLAPGLDLIKTGLLGRWRGVVGSPDPNSPVDSSTRSDPPLVAVRGGVRNGLSEVLGFVRATPGLHALVLLVGVAGFATGWNAAEPLAGVVTASILDRLSGHVPPVAALEFFANNLTVALGTALAGVALGVPSIVAVWFNGFAFGIIFRLEAELPALLAFVLPHGVLEIPALVVSGALGLHLARSGWRTWRGRASRESLAEDLVYAIRVLVGVGILLFLAGLIEGFLSPYYFRPFL